MITDSGKSHIKRYLAGQVGAIGDAIALGSSDAAVTTNDEKLAFETERVDVVFVGYDFVTDKLVFKAVLPQTFVGSFYEIGLYSQDVNAAAGAYDSRMIVTFESDEESWTNATFNSTNTRLGEESLRQSPSASATSTSTLTEMAVDLSGNASTDRFVLAFNVSNSNCASVIVRFKTDASNYGEMVVLNPVAGWNFIAVNKGAVAVTGVIDWGDIASIDILTTAKAAGSTIVDFDGLRIENTNTDNLDYVLVAREVLSTPYVKVAGTSEEIEFSLGVTI